MRPTLWIPLILAAATALCLAGHYQVKARRRWKPTEILLAPQAAWENITPVQRQGVAALFKDCLECGGGLALVEHEAALPKENEALDTLTLRVCREGDRIQVQILRKRAGRPDETLDTGLEAPSKAIAAALAALEVEDGVVKLLIPRNPETFWLLAGVTDWRLENKLPLAMEACAGLVEREPECASAWLAKARVANLYLLTNSGEETDTQQQCEGDFLRAMDLAPDFPRAVTSYARFKTDIGNQHGALEMLFAALHRYPRVPRLYEAVAYAARTAGLLDGAALALQQRDRILGLSRGEAGLTENTYLYLGNLDTFEVVLGASDATPDSLRDFYHGYARLVRGDRAGAERWFTWAHFHPGGIPQFDTLSNVYYLGLRGQTGGALALLRGLWAARVPMRVPDGEYTFKLAEAFSFLGSQSEAQDVATRAFAQGFGCTRYYQESPLLAGIRNTPRWNALEQHLQGRQLLSERLFPTEAFRF